MPYRLAIAQYFDIDDTVYKTFKGVANMQSKNMIPLADEWKPTQEDIIFTNAKDIITYHIFYVKILLIITLFNRSLLIINISAH